MGYVYELLSKLSLDKSEYDKGLNNAELDAHSSGGKIGEAFTKMGKVTAAAFTAASAAVVAMTTASVMNYAETEQLVGGVKKLYGNMGLSLEEYANSVGKSVDEVKGDWQNMEDAQNLVLENSKNAYKTAGMSANQYMETATSFSAALINSLGGDTVKAAEQTDVAMRAISDNVNTFGTDMESVTNAFQGFAKQNYTMLDNLKLGYGGTKEEMERLIADANEYAAANGQAADLTIDSFSDIVTAIELVQEKQNIAGTTAREASTTIEGSLNMVKGAWANLVAGFADPDADIGQLVQNVFDSVVGTTDEAGNHINGFLDNLVPAIERALKGFGTAVSGLAPLIGETLPGLIEGLLPTLLTSAVQLFAGLIAALPSLFASLTSALQTAFSSLIEQLPELWATISTAVGELFENIDDILDPLIEMVLNLLDQVGTALAENLPTFFANVLPKILELAEYIRENAGRFVDAGIDLILNLMQGLMDSLPTLIEYIPEIITNILGVINDNMPKILMMGIQLIIMLAKGLIDAIPAIIENMGKIVEMIISIVSAINWLNLGKEVITFIANGIKALQAEAPNIMKSIFDKVVSTIKNIDWIGTGKSVLQFLGQGIQGIAQSIPNILRSIFEAGVNALKSIDWISLGKNIIQGVVNGIKALGSQIKEVLLGFASSALDGVKDFFGIHSPSRVMRDQVGKWIPLGMALGIEENADQVEDAMGELEEIPDRSNLTTALADNIAKAVDFGSQMISLPTVETTGVLASGNGANGLNFTQNIYSPQALTPSEIARQTRNANRELVLALRGI